MLKEEDPELKTVFIGPCISKKAEADESPYVDCVLTFEELSAWFEKEGITVEAGEDHTEESRARLFPTTGGILRTMACDDPEYTYMAIDGVENCINALEDIKSGKMENCFVEMSACFGTSGIHLRKLFARFSKKLLQNARRADIIMKLS